MRIVLEILVCYIITAYFQCLMDIDMTNAGDDDVVFWLNSQTTDCQFTGNTIRNYGREKIDDGARNIIAENHEDGFVRIKSIVPGSRA